MYWYTSTKKAGAALDGRRGEGKALTQHSAGEGAATATATHLSRGLANESFVACESLKRFSDHGADIHSAHVALQKPAGTRGTKKNDNFFLKNELQIAT